MALDPGKALTQYRHHAWTERDGLLQSYVQAILQTRDGYLWIGTQEGLVRFDGHRFRVFDQRNTPVMPKSSILSLLEDAHGKLWIALDSPHILTFEEGRFESHPRRATSDVPRVLHQDPEGDLWVGGADGLCKVSADRLTGCSPGNGLPKVAVHALASGGGVLWVGTDRGLWRRHNGRFTTVGAAAGLVNAVLPEPDGTVWVGTDAGLFRLAGGGHSPAWTGSRRARSGPSTGTVEGASGSAPTGRASSAWRTGR